MGQKKKATFSLRIGVIAALDDAMARGVATNKSALVERALPGELRELRRQDRRAQWEQAAQDPLFLKDLEEVEAAFQSADAETANGIR